MAIRVAGTAWPLRYFRTRTTKWSPGSKKPRSRVRYGRLYHGGISGLGNTITSPGRIRVRRDAGEWLRSQIQISVTGVVAVLSANLGLIAGVGLAGYLGWRVAALPVLCLAGAAVFLVRRYERDRFCRLLKGAAAERTVGGAIEYAITTPGCAIAHSVTKIADIGDIDHMVATPNTLWVIETKYRKVPNDHFAEVLRRISVNVQAVRRWGPRGVSVRGVLVLATENEMSRKHLYENGQVELLDQKSLIRKLRHESTRQPCKEDLLIARRVWKLAGEELVQRGS